MIESCSRFVGYKVKAELEIGRFGKQGEFPVAPSAAVFA